MQYKITFKWIAEYVYDTMPECDDFDILEIVKMEK